MRKVYSCLIEGQVDSYSLQKIYEGWNKDLKLMLQIENWKSALIWLITLLPMKTCASYKINLWQEYITPDLKYTDLTPPPLLYDWNVVYGKTQ